MNRQKEKGNRRRSRHLRVRRKIAGTSERPRLSVYKSLAGIYAQIIDDVTGKTLVASSTAAKDLKDKLKYGGNCAAAKAVGADIAGRAIAAGIRKVVFDRGGRKYHGRIKALAEAAREAGIQF